MTQEKFKYYFEGQGFKNKRTLGRAVVESQLSPYGKQLLERIIQDAAENVSSTQDLTTEEALKRIYVGFKSNDISQANTNLEEVAAQTNGDNFIYMIGYAFVAGGAIIQLSQEKITSKMINTTDTIHSSLPVEVDEDPTAPQYSPESSTGDTYQGGKNVSDDFRIRD